MANVHELCTIKNFTVLLALHIGTNEPTDPVISDHDGWEYFKLAERLEGNECKKDKLLCNIGGSLSIIWLRKQLWIMKPYIIDSTIFTSMDTKLILKVGSIHFHVSFIFEPVPNEIICLFLFVVLIVWSHNINLLPKPCQLLG